MKPVPANPPEPCGQTAATPPQQSGIDHAIEQQLTFWQRRLFHVRLAKLNRFNELVAAGHSRISAASEARCGYVTIWKWEKRVAAQGVAGLIPRKSKGCPPLLDPALYTPSVVIELQRLAVKLGGSRAAARVFARSPLCPRALADYIVSRDAIPDRLRKLLGYRRASRPIRVAGRFVHVIGAGIDQEAA